MRTDSQSERGHAAKLGVTVSRRVGNAIVRNRVKRQIREWFRIASGQFRDGRDFVAIARPAAAAMGADEISRELSHLSADAERKLDRTDG